MTPLAATNSTAPKRTDYSDKDSFDVLYYELEKGIKSMKNGEVYTIDETWEEIDKI